MLKIIDGLSNAFSSMNAFSKYAIKYGNIIILTLFAAAFYFCFFSDNSFIFTELLTSIRELTATLYILPLLAEIILIMSGKRSKSE